MTKNVKAPDFILPGIEDITRRDFLVGGAGLLALGLAGCGSGDGGDGGAATRTAQTPRGPVQIPADPRRVLTVYTHDLANALALGLPVIAGPGEDGQPGADFPPYLRKAFGEELQDVTRTAYQPQTNVEEVAALGPDVIFAAIWGSDTDNPLYGRFDEIAPTVTYFYAGGEEDSVLPWRTVLRRNGGQFGRRQEAEDFIARYEERASGLRERLAPRWAGATYALLFPEAAGVFLIGPDGGGHIPSTLGDDLGLALDGSVGELLADAGPLSQGGAVVSFEKLGEIAADVLFIIGVIGPDGAPDRSGIEALTGQPLWSRLPAVRAGQVHEFTGDIFYESGPMAMAFLDVVERSLLS